MIWGCPKAIVPFRPYIILSTKWDGTLHGSPPATALYRGPRSKRGGRTATPKIQRAVNFEMAYGVGRGRGRRLGPGPERPGLGLGPGQAGPRPRPRAGLASALCKQREKKAPGGEPKKQKTGYNVTSFGSPWFAAGSPPGAAPKTGYTG